MFFGLTIEKLLLIGVIAALLVGPERPPGADARPAPLPPRRRRQRSLGAGAAGAGVAALAGASDTAAAPASVASAPNATPYDSEAT